MAVKLNRGVAPRQGTSPSAPAPSNVGFSGRFPKKRDAADVSDPDSPNYDPQDPDYDESLDDSE